MNMSKVKRALQYEYKRYQSRGWKNFLSILMFLFCYHFIPKLIFFGSQFFPESSPPIFYTFGSYIVHLVGYFIGNCFYFLLYSLKNPYIESWKINKNPWPWEKSVPEYKAHMKKLVKLNLINQLIVTPLTILIVGLDSDYQISSDLPPTSEIVPQILFFILCEDFFFYFTHRALHSPFLYKHVHKYHHEFNITISVAAEYCHPFEYVFGNSLPFVSGPMIFGQKNIHIMTWFTWVLTRAMNTCEGHSGYEVPWSTYAFLPFSSSVAYHDYHHSHNIGNYGSTFVIMDSMFGTNQSFWNYQQKYQENKKSSE